MIYQRTQEILLIVLNLILINVNAQPVLTAANTSPVLGDAFHSFMGGNVPSPGNSGANQTWNFSALSASFAGLDSVIPTSSAMHSIDFPSADISFLSGGSYDFYSVDTDSLNYLGGGSFSWEQIDSNPETYLTYPFTFNSTFTDSYIASFNNAGTISRITGTVTVTGDGYGTLQLPFGAYNDVLRVKRIENELWMTNGTPFNSTYTKYLWYLPGIHQPILMLTFSTSTGDYMTTYLSSQTVGIKEFESLNGVRHFPNPFSYEMTLEFRKPINNGVIIIYNSQGQFVKENQNIFGLTYKFMRDKLKEGIYFIQVREDGKIIANDKIFICN